MSKNVVPPFLSKKSKPSLYDAHVYVQSCVSKTYTIIIASGSRSKNRRPLVLLCDNKRARTHWSTRNFVCEQHRPYSERTGRWKNIIFDWWNSKIKMPRIKGRRPTVGSKIHFTRKRTNRKQRRPAESNDRAEKFLKKTFDFQNRLYSMFTFS